MRHEDEEILRAVEALSLLAQLCRLRPSSPSRPTTSAPLLTPLRQRTSAHASSAMLNNVYGSIGHASHRM